ncbi:MAG: TM2 domain-containing protein [archaeon]|nr:TM2 domain-containing protein [archaeon]
MEEKVEVKSKSKVVAFLLAFLFGMIGIHNFYLGRWKKGFIQFFFVVLTFGAGLFLTIPWAWLEGLLILIGKYKLTQEQKPDDVDIESDDTKEKTNPMKEYFITAGLMVSLLLLVPITSGMILVAAVLFYFIVGGLWNVFTRFFIRTILPLYATVFSSGKKFLIRFSEYRLPATSERIELFKSTRKLSMTAIFVLLFAISLIAQSNVPLVAEGEGRDAVFCADGTFEFDAFFCDEYDESIEQVFVPCNKDCILENTSVIDRIMEAYTDLRVFSILMFAPLITVFVGPVIVLKFSSLSIVDKKTRSMSPIGQKANDLTNVVAGFGSVVLFSQTAWKISTSSIENGGIFEGAVNTATIFIVTVVMLILIYPLIWLPMLKFTKSLESHVVMLDDQLVQKKGIEIHELMYENNELRIVPSHSSTMDFSRTTKIDSAPEHIDQNQSAAEDSVIVETPEQIAITEDVQTESTVPEVNTVAQKTDDHGFEWLQYNGENYYRQVGSNAEWTKY